MRGSRPCSGRDGPHEAPHLSLQSPGVLREFRVVRRRNPFPHAPELIGKGLQGLLLIQPTAMQPKGFILDQAVRALITHVEVDWRAQTKNRVAMNDAYHSLSGICREGREVLRPPSHHPSFYRTVHSHAKPLTPRPFARNIVFPHRPIDLPPPAAVHPAFRFSRVTVPVVPGLLSQRYASRRLRMCRIRMMSGFS